MQVLTVSSREGETKLSLSSLLDVVAPVLQQFILEGKAAEDSGHEIKQVPSSFKAYQLGLQAYLYMQRLDLPLANTL